MIGNRLRQLIANCDQPLSQALSNYFDRSTDWPIPSDNEEYDYTTGPYWIHLPGWIYRKYKHQSDGEDRRVLDDFIWGQFCTYLAIRIKDDLFDGHVESDELFLAVDIFFREGKHSFANYIPSTSSFWDIYDSHLELSSQAMLDVDRLQKLISSPPDLLLVQYAKVSSIFKLGSAAVCTHLHRTDLYPRFAAGIDHLSIVSQIRDDLHDISEDVANSRYNYSYCFLVGFGSDDKDIKVSSCKDLKDVSISPQAMLALFSTIQKHLEDAKREFHSLGIRELNLYLDRYQDSINAIKKRYLGEYAQRLSKQLGLL